MKFGFRSIAALAVMSAVMAGHDARALGDGNAEWSKIVDAAKREKLTLRGLGIDPTAVEAIVPSYLWRFRKTGQFKTGRFA